ncbi:hypothetical protein DLAC_03866 [Tieghemostelium lacteum]|uniref:PPPDE domain-containing protein n=1 Tax=Tieghemostelium lacteum TaxID=361077 RepID=A0A152A0X2_TIELA|nr:hypothetical protein DLAC_03866 [Tieghemostelium lacteum]|eukprot:KYQ99901.1 hypothetical protein DLAC_03866 [Tieghemostelium lacteum]
MNQQRTENKRKENVYINVYDLHPINNYTYLIGLGAYHSGVEVYGTEYSFGGHEFSFSGVFEIEPKTVTGANLRESILIGETTLTNKQVQNLVDKIADEFAGNSYHPLQKNCNSFTKEFIKRLLNKEIPSYINRLAQIGNYFNCILPTSITSMNTPKAITTETTSLTQGQNGFSSNTPSAISSMNSTTRNNNNNNNSTYSSSFSSNSGGGNSNYSSFQGSGFSLTNSTNSILSSLSSISSPNEAKSPRDEEKRNSILVNKKIFEQNLDQEELLEDSNQQTSPTNSNFSSSSNDNSSTSSNNNNNNNSNNNNGILI